VCGQGADEDTKDEKSDVCVRESGGVELFRKKG
jgi:hypothetical protein